MKPCLIRLPLLMALAALVHPIPSQAAMNLIPLTLTPQQQQQLPERVINGALADEESRDETIRCVQRRRAVRLNESRNRVTLRRLDPGIYHVKYRALQGTGCAAAKDDD